jgi:hypothetical protein
LVRLLLWLSWLISRKPNQTPIVANALILKAERKLLPRTKHAGRCFCSFGCASFLPLPSLPLKLRKIYPPPATERPTCPATVPQIPVPFLTALSRDALGFGAAAAAMGEASIPPGHPCAHLPASFLRPLLPPQQLELDR